MEDIFKVLDTTYNAILDEVRKINNGAEVSENYAVRLKDEIFQLKIVLESLENTAMNRIVSVKTMRFRQALDDLMEVADIFICPNVPDDYDSFDEEDEFKKIEATYDFYVNTKKED